MFYLKLDADGYIKAKAAGESMPDTSYIEVSSLEFTNASNYRKFDIDSREFSEPIQKDTIKILKENKIKKSKEILSQWLQEHPIKSEIHNSKGEYYTVTQEKQSQLTQLLMLYSISKANGSDMQLTWNCTGGVCEKWTYESLSTLSFQIADYVLPRVKKQQLYEVEINKCETIEEVEAIEIEYDTI